MRFLRALTRGILQLIGLLTVIGAIAGAIALPILPRILQVEDRIEKADMIVPLAGDWHRLIKAAELYKAGYAPRVVLSNAYVRPATRIDAIREDMGLPRPEPHEFRPKLLTHLGVPIAAMDAFGDGHTSTLEEAEAFRDFLKTHAPATGNDAIRVILVTSSYHTRRAKTVFEDTMPGVRFLVTAPPEDRLKKKWWTNQRSAVLSAVESLKFLHYLLGGRLGGVTSSP
jgi:uncharacterized SAM-binding protein YcdF (DUF218 family)